jgi:AcrR family transcriptional regulator
LTPRSDEQNRAIREKRRADIERAATGMLLEKGYAGIRMEEVARAAGVSKGTLYWYFDSKAELFQQALEHMFDEMMAPALAIADAEGDPLEILGHLVEVSVAMANAKDPGRHVVMAAMSDPELFDPVKDFGARMYEDFIGIAEGLFRRAGREDAREMAFLFGAAIDGLALPPMLGVELPPAERLVAAAKRMIRPLTND